MGLVLQTEERSKRKVTPTNCQVSILKRHTRFRTNVPNGHSIHFVGKVSGCPQFHALSYSPLRRLLPNELNSRTISENTTCWGIAMTTSKWMIRSLLLISLFLSFEAYSQNPVDGFECNPMPIPTRPTGPTVKQTWAWYDSMYELTAWRFPCSEAFSYVMLTVVPLENQDPFLCSVQIILAQGDSKLDDSPVLTQDPYFNQSGWCEPIVLPTSFALIPRDDESPIDFQEKFVVHWDTGREDQQFEMFAYDPAEYTVFGDSEFRINEGLNDVFPEIKMMFLSWFTYDTERPDENVPSNLGDPGHRWLTAFGPYDGSQAVLKIDITHGGIFNSGIPKPTHKRDGTIKVDFTDCNTGVVSFNIPSIGQQSAIPIERITLDLVPFCEQLDGVSK